MKNYTEANAAMCDVLRGYIASESTTDRDRERYVAALEARIGSPERFEPAVGFRVARIWRDGESMSIKTIAAVDTLADAILIQSRSEAGAWVERIEDGVVVRP